MKGCSFVLFPLAARARAHVRRERRVSSPWVHFVMEVISAVKRERERERERRDGEVRLSFMRKR